MLEKQNRILRNDNALLKSHFKTIKVVDSTTISFPENLKGELVLLNFLNKIIKQVLRYGRKSTKKGRKSTYLIIENVKIYESELVNIAI
jgi:hypothetical protein